MRSISIFVAILALVQTSPSVSVQPMVDVSSTDTLDSFSGDAGTDEPRGDASPETQRTDAALSCVGRTGTQNLELCDRPGFFRCSYYQFGEICQYGVCCSGDIDPNDCVCRCAGYPCAPSRGTCCYTNGQNEVPPDTLRCEISDYCSATHIYTQSRDQ